MPGHRTLRNLASAAHGLVVAGLTVFAVSFPLWIAARVQLGDAFSVRAEPRRLVTTGLYARPRHPIYLFGTAAYFGSFLALQVCGCSSYGSR